MNACGRTGDTVGNAKEQSYFNKLLRFKAPSSEPAHRKRILFNDLLEFRC